MKLWKYIVIPQILWLYPQSLYAEKIVVSARKDYVERLKTEESLKPKIELAKKILAPENIEEYSQDEKEWARKFLEGIRESNELYEKAENVTLEAMKLNGLGYIDCESGDLERFGYRIADGTKVDLLLKYAKADVHTNQNVTEIKKIETPENKGKTNTVKTYSFKDDMLAEIDPSLPENDLLIEKKKSAAEILSELLGWSSRLQGEGFLRSLRACCLSKVCREKYRQEHPAEKGPSAGQK